MKAYVYTILFALGLVVYLCRKTVVAAKSFEEQYMAGQPNFNGYLGVAIF